MFISLYTYIEIYCIFLKLLKNYNSFFPPTSNKEGVGVRVNTVAQKSRK